MNRVIITFLFFIGIAVSSCTTSKSVVSQNADLSKYEYASIINNDTYHIPAQLMEYEIQLFDAVEGNRTPAQEPCTPVCLSTPSPVS